MATRRLAVVPASALCALLLLAVVSMWVSGADAARRLETRRDQAAVAVAPLVANERLQMEMAGPLVPGNETDGSVAASERLSPGGPDPQHH
ncbi:hypothetical protein EJB05_17491, partial [Eragrostis curvula]